MTPAARLQAAIEVLDAFVAGDAAERALTNWARGHRFAGSGDRAAIRDLVYHALRRLRSLAVRGGAHDGRGLMLGWCHEQGIDPASLFGADRHAPAPLAAGEGVARQPSPDDLLDLPDWLITRLRADLGVDLPRVATALRDRAPVFLRANPLRGDPAAAIDALAADGVEAVFSPDVKNALQVVSGERKISSGHAYLEGLVEVQDLSSQAAVMALPDVAGLRVLDYCAGGGGKALALAARGAQVHAHDISAARLAPLRDRAHRAGADVALIAPGQVSGQFDLVVVDVPCSGAGTWRRTPEAKWRLTPDRLAELVATQAEVLRQAAGHVAPGGQLAYLTCSLLADENESQISVLQSDPQWRTEDVRRWLPQIGGGDGFFLARATRLG
ncbi:RsmB/NOP family class I SAM-dependent RNA methyltransferase [Paracoccus sp. p3-h83]|uniref:RsmB/NOP family class I SAM-dependent RNA methyltransferase n=1 Tax=Paracoccus sp. p3-h83 TaxID=3342805 RepID=UPI0035B6B7C4